MNMDNMKLEAVNVADLRSPEDNVRNHPAKQIEELKRSIQKFGQIRPFVIDEDNVVWAGNGMLAAMVEMGIETAQAYRVNGMSDSDKKKLMLSDNKVYALGLDNLANTEKILMELDDFDVPGYSMSVLEDLYGGGVEGIIEDVMGYGTVPEEDVERINKKAEEHVEAEQLSPAPAPKPIEVKDENGDVVDTAEVKAVEYEPKDNVAQFIICPKCGEKIWL